MNETMHVLAAFMMVMTGSGGTMEGEGWDSGVTVVGKRGGVRVSVCLCVSLKGRKLISLKCQLAGKLFFLIYQRKTNSLLNPPKEKCAPGLITECRKGEEVCRHPGSGSVLLRWHKRKKS